MKRYLLKLSGEALIGKYNYGIDPDIVNDISANIVEVNKTKNQLAVVVGGGNIFRGAGLAEAGLDRVTGDNIGMLATVINSLALQDAIEKLGTQCRVMSAVRINQISEDYIRRRAIRHLEKGRIVVLAAGTGNPFFTTDSAASLRSIEIDAELLIKATKVDGIYDSDPKLSDQAKLIENSDSLVRVEGIVRWYNFTGKYGIIKCLKDSDSNSDPALNSYDDYFVYVTDTKDNLYDGQGTYTYASGDKYVGDWVDDKRTGKGTLTWENGAKNFMQGIYLGYMYSRWRKLKGLNLNDPRENSGQMQSNFKEFESKIKKD